MGRVRAKLRSSSGASMLIALSFLLLCLTVGAVVLTAASSNAGRMAHAQSSQQAYLTVSSAAGLLRDELDGLTFTAGEWRSVDSYDGGVSVGAITPQVSPAGGLNELAGTFARQIFEADTVYLSPKFPLSDGASLSVEAPGFERVGAVLSIAGDYTLTLKLSLTSDPGMYPLTLTMPAVIQDSTADDVSYYNITVIEDVEGVPTEVTYTYQITTSTRTVTAVWGSGIISKGD